MAGVGQQIPLDKTQPYGAKGTACSGCGKPVWRGSTSQAEPICQLCRKIARQRICEKCERPFEARGKDRPDAPNRFCSAACRVDATRLYDDPRAAAKASTRARKLRHAETWDGVTDRQICERDRWACRIPRCDLGPIRADLAFPDPRSPSVDHIIPLSLGGADTAPNKRAAHLACNVRRGNRMLPDDVQVVTPVLAPLGILPSRRQPKPQALCTACSTVPVKRAGRTCQECRDAAGTGRRQQVLDCRSRGLTWKETAAACGLSGPGAAHNVAYPPGSDAWAARSRPRSRPAPDLDSRLWWTTVRPLIRS